MTDKLKAAKVPCGSCPYRKDVPSGIWEKHEYEKLLIYDKEISDQLIANAGAFLCHQKDGHLCAGWLACHGWNLATLRLAAVGIGEDKYDESVFNYTTTVPVFMSGAEAKAHGIKDYVKPKSKARRMMEGLMRKGVVKPD